ncbi:putative asparagine linked glycosylation protein [Myxozyma melibiosi]|uniref:UDP-N-acetylglucosamine transferase subunit ALG14 n=1 Tax=Myxozyma melibiosi TaxID=54550 RepID=A0ABR1F8S7_9ASCO
MFFDHITAGACLLALLIVTILLVIAMLSLIRSYVDDPVQHPDGASAMFVLGSGGHTTELLSIVNDLRFEKYPNRTWVSFSGDSLSIVRAMDLEQKKRDEAQDTKSGKSVGSMTSVHLPRARTVGQSYFTSIFTTLICALQCLYTVYNVRPDLIICNGPGSCVPICFAALLLRALGLSRGRIVYVESLARVNSLSLTGKMLYYVVDRFIVQWPQLAEQYEGAEYVGLIA